MGQIPLISGRAADAFEANSFAWCSDHVVT
jgi:hypothetical protein